MIQSETLDAFTANFKRVSDQVIRMVNSGEDGTVSYDGSDLPMIGYYVGGRYPSLVLGEVEGVASDAIDRFINTTPAAEHYGVWTDTETGKVYIDAVDWIESVEHALQTAAERNEIAIWDIERSEELRLDSLQTAF